MTFGPLEVALAFLAGMIFGYLWLLLGALLLGLLPTLSASKPLGGG